MYTIYKITNTINKKAYVGLTKQKLARRWYLHRWEAQQRNNQCHFHRAIRAYDKSVWQVEALCCCVCLEDAEFMERFMIFEHNTHLEGYNMTEGGDAFDGLRGHYNGMYGRTHNSQVKQQLAQNARRRFKGKTYEELYGREKAQELSEQRRQKMILLHQKKDCTGTNNSNAKAVVVKGKHFSTGSDAANYFNVTQPTISRWVKEHADSYHI